MMTRLKWYLDHLSRNQLKLGPTLKKLSGSAHGMGLGFNHLPATLTPYYFSVSWDNHNFTPNLVAAATGFGVAFQLLKNYVLSHCNDQGNKSNNNIKK